MTPAAESGMSVMETARAAALRMREGGARLLVVLAPEGELCARRLEAVLLPVFPDSQWRFGLWAGEEEAVPRVVVAQRRPRFLRTLQDWVCRSGPRNGGPAALVDAGRGTGCPEAEQAAEALARSPFFSMREVLPALVAGQWDPAAFWRQAAREAADCDPPWLLEQRAGERGEMVAAGRVSPELFWLRQLEFSEVLQCLRGSPWAACRGAAVAQRLLLRDLRAEAPGGDSLRQPCPVGSGVAGAARLCRALTECFRRAFSAYSRPLAFYALALLARAAPELPGRLWRDPAALSLRSAAVEPFARDLLAAARAFARSARPGDAFSDPVFFARLLLQGEDFLFRAASLCGAGFSEAYGDA